VGAQAGGERFQLRILLHLGRGGEALAGLEGPTRSSQVARAVCLAHLGRHEEARAIRDGFGDMGAEEDESGIAHLTLSLEAAVLDGDRETAQALARRLAPLAPYPWAKQVDVSYARLLGAAAALLGNREQAKAYYRQAL